MPLNTNTYVIAVDNTSKKATLLGNDVNYPNLVIENGSTTACFVFSSPSSSATAVFPTSAVNPLAGKFIAPGATVAFGKEPGDQYVYAIQATSGTGNLYLSPGFGH